MGTKKINCRVFTPQDIVIRMLDMLGYKENLYGRKVLENSCGNGQFLIEIIKRYIQDCRQNGYNDDEIRVGLSKDICAFETDTDTFNECIRRLNRLVKEFSISDVRWSIFNADALKSEQPGTYSFVVGNPPYITYSALSTDNREFIRKAFSVCAEGKPDYYYAFIESALKCLRADGRMAYLLPSNFFKTSFGLKVRTYLLPSLTDVYDFGGQRIFESALTASVIIICDKRHATHSVIYHDIVGKKEKIVAKDHLNGRWIFNWEQKKGISSDLIRFGDRFSTSSSIATLCNDAFIIDADAPELMQIETAVVRKAVSPKSITRKREERIIFPYYYNDDGKLQRYSEEEFISFFPAATAHLKKYKSILDSRDSDKLTKWFEYGRSQAIRHMNQDKLMMSTVITGAVRTTLLDKDTIPYTGFYIIAKNGYDLSDAKRILESNTFFEYAKAVGVQVNGSSVRVSIKDINNYMFALT